MAPHHTLFAGPSCLPQSPPHHSTQPGATTRFLFGFVLRIESTGPKNLFLAALTDQTSRPSAVLFKEHQDKGSSFTLFVFQASNHHYYLTTFSTSSSRMAEQYASQATCKCPRWFPETSEEIPKSRQPASTPHISLITLLSIPRCNPQVNSTTTLMCPSQVIFARNSMQNFNSFHSKCGNLCRQISHGRGFFPPQDKTSYPSAQVPPRVEYGATVMPAILGQTTSVKIKDAHIGNVLDLRVGIEE